MGTIRVLLADDHKSIRVGLNFILNHEQDIVVVGEAENGDEALRLVDELSPDVLVTDLKMPGMDGVDIIRQLRAAGSPVRILVLTVNITKERIVEALSAGANGYLAKDDAIESLAHSVRCVMHNERCLSPLVEKSFFATSTDESNPFVPSGL